MLTKYQVVIAGAGPVGCWLAGELQLAGISTLVLEQSESIDPQSRALTVHPRTIETFASRGVEKAFLDEGVAIPAGHFGLLDYRLNFRPLESPYPFTLAILQARTTELLQQRARDLGAEIRRGHKVQSFAETDSAVTVAVQGPGGPYSVDTEYLVGCDGVRSTVRNCAGIPFPGTDATVYGWLGDVILDAPPDDVAINKWTSAGAIAVVKLPGGRHRLVGISPDDVRTDRPGEFTLDELRTKTVAIMGTDYGMHSPSWLSRYSNTARQAEAYRKGRILLAGDAAHQHMPAGGVGLNVGIQDAMNLGWKLAATIHGWAPAGLLDSYHAERHPVGQNLLEHTQAQTLLMSVFTNECRDLRSLLQKLILENPALEMSLVKRLTGLSVAYPSAEPAHALVGQRVPNLMFQRSGEGVFQKLHNGRYVMLDLRANTACSSPLSGDDLGRHASSCVDVHFTALTADAPAPWAGLTAMLVRPDGYLAWASEDHETAALKAGLARAGSATFAPASAASITAEVH
ncbi:FAD-dependent monooxygenase [Cupriavidus taiwanensis]|uniref:FAD-dependent monooxygenase n=1 Tax=Cupriavidus taiwanensis TaxID=164546 RepID=UPI0039C0682D